MKTEKDLMSASRSCTFVINSTDSAKHFQFILTVSVTFVCKNSSKLSLSIHTVHVSEKINSMFQWYKMITDILKIFHILI